MISAPGIPMTAAQDDAPVTAPAYGLFPAGDFRVTSGECDDCATIAQALWYFRDECIAVPHSGLPLAGFDPHRRLADELRHWAARTPPGSARDYPPLVWIGAPDVLTGCRLDAEGRRLHTVDGLVDFAPRLPSNRSYANGDSVAYLSARELRLRGRFVENPEAGAGATRRRFVARSVWPEDFRLDADAPLEPIAASAPALRAWVRSAPSGGARSRFASRLVWQREPGAAKRRAGRALVAIMLNGAQGDDDEAHAGHFGLCAGRVGQNGQMHDWLIANYYTLDSESEKGILSAMSPLDAYLADLNSGQAWYRPSYMLVATLRDERVAAHLSSALARVFNLFYRHQFAYDHARANCTGICLATLRALGWCVPTLGATGWLKALLALPWVGLTSGQLKQGRASFDYLTEERTCLFPQLAFEQAGADLLRLAGGARPPGTPFEALLARDVEEALLVRIPQLPSSRAWGTHPVASVAEYQRRLPRDPRERQIIPVGPRPFPRELRDPATPRERPRRSTLALVGYAVVGALLLGAWAAFSPRRACGRRDG
jgi:hypothetical protein